MAEALNEPIVLLSVGRHPASGRPRAAPRDARALALALKLAGDATIGLHGGSDERILRDYLGMGLRRLVRLDLPADADPLPALVAWLRQHSGSLVLAGEAAEHGHGSGFLPYAAAEALGDEVLPAVVGIAPACDGWTVRQALAGGRRRILRAPRKLVAIVGAAAPEPPQIAFGRARRGSIKVVAAGPATPATAPWTVLPARPLPKTVPAPARTGTAEGLLDVPAGAGRLLVHPTAEAAARAVFDELDRAGLIDPAIPPLR